MLPRKRIRQDHGQDLVETALTLPLLLMLLFGIVEFGRVIFVYNSLSNAAREGARYAIIHPASVSLTRCVDAGPSDTIVLAACASTQGLPQDMVEVQVSTPSGAVRVVVTGVVQLFFGPIIQAFGGSGTVTLPASATMQIE